MNENDDCMIELETHKSENGGHIATTFVLYLKEKYSIPVVKECVEELS